MSTLDSSIVDKIKKLLALAGNNPNEAEATSALAKAQELLARYNLSMAQLDQSRGTAKETTEAEGTRTKTKVERSSAMFTYQRSLWAALAETNFCVYWSTKIFHESGIYSTHHHNLVGREENVKTVELMGVYLEQAVNRLCPYKSGKDVNLWKTGCIERICERLKEDATSYNKSMEDSASQCTGIAIADVRDRETHANHMYQHPDGAWWCPCQRCYAVRSAENTRRWNEELAKQRAMPTAAVETIGVKKETDAQRRKREEREERESNRYWNKHAKRESQERAKRESEAFKNGRITGNSVSLNSQIDKGQSR
jgi:hypothetical protein